MRTVSILAAASALAVAAPTGTLLPGAQASAPGASAASCGPPEGPLLGIGRIDGRRTLARLEPRTLRPHRDGRVALPLRVDAHGWAFSPGCDAIALPVYRGRILLVDIERGRRTGSLTLGGRPAVSPLAWPTADRLIGFTGPYRFQRVVTVSVPEGRVVGKARLGGRPWAVAATSLGLLALVGHPDRVSATTLVMARADGQVLRVPLSRIRAGYDDTGPSVRFAREVTPGLAVDETLGKAYVVAADEALVAEVDLATGATTYHELRAAGAPGASAADRIAYGPFLSARWLGDGTIAVAGGTIVPRPGPRGQRATRIDPSGLRLIRTADWSLTPVDPRLPWFEQAGGALVGMTSATGLVAYGTDATRAFTRLRGTRPATLFGAAWPYAYVTGRGPRRTYVVDLRTGRTTTTLPGQRPPALLVR